MRRIAGVLLLFWLVSAAPATATVIEGVRFPARISVAETPLVQLGVSLLRYRLFIKAYVSSLYVGEGVKPQQLFDDEPKRLEIEYFWGITASDFREATRAGIAANLGTEVAKRLGRKIDAFNALYRDVEPGDRYAVTYLPDRGTELALNGKALGLIPGAEFGAAVFSIWFGDKPFDAGMKADLLGEK